MSGEFEHLNSFNRMTRGLSVSRVSAPSPYILLSKISKLSNRTIKDLPNEAEKILEKNRASVDDVKNRFFNKIQKFDSDQLMKVYDMMDINILKTIRVIENYPLKQLIKKKVIPRKK